MVNHQLRGIRAGVGSKATKMEVFHHVHHIIVVALVAAGCVAVELANAVEGSRTIGNSSYLQRHGFILQVDTHLDTSELQDINTQLLEKKGPDDRPGAFRQIQGIQTASSSHSTHVKDCAAGVNRHRSPRSHGDHVVRKTPVCLLMGWRRLTR
jgi:hypothetical protein